MSRVGVRQIVTAVNPKQYAEILAYTKKKKLSVYGLIKKALFEFIERHP